MDKGIWFWVIYVIVVLVGLFFSWPDPPYERGRFRPLGVVFAIFILIFLLGWGTFGPPIH